jgi:hypothetical protein
MQLLLEMAAVAKEEKSMSKALDHDKDHDVSAYIGDEDSIGGSGSFSCLLLATVVLLTRTRLLDHEMDFFSSPECSPVKPPSRRASPVWDENHSQKRKRSNGKKMTRRFITSTPDGNKPRRAESGGETPLCELSTNTPARVRRTPKSGLSTPSFGLDEVSDSPISAYAPTPRIYDLANEKSPENFRSEAKVLDFGQSPSIVSLDDIDNLESRLYDSLSGTQIDKSSSTLAQPSSPERYDREQRSDIREENAVAVQGPIVPDMTVENEAMPDEPSTSEVPAVAANLQSGALDTSIDSSENVESVALPLSSLAVDMPDHEPEEVIESSIATPSPRSRTLTSLVSATIYIDDKNYLGIKPPMRRSKSSSCGRLVLSHLLVCLLTCLTLDVFVPLIYCEEGSDCYIFAT